MPEDATTAAMRRMVQVNRNLIRERALAEGDAETAAEMDEIDAREAAELAAKEAEDPNAKAHAYIRTLERQLEAANADAKRAWAEVEKLDAEVMLHAGKLGAHREWLVARFRELETTRAECRAVGDDAEADCARDQLIEVNYAIRNFDELTGRK